MERRTPKANTQPLLGPYKRHELLTGEICYPVLGYSGYGDGTGRDLTAFISEEMRADWEANREELLAFWASGEYTTPDIFPDSLPWLFIGGPRARPGYLPWAAKVFDPPARKPQNKMASRSEGDRND